MRVFMCGFGLRSGIFYFIPTIRYTWEECGCWMVAIAWGNFGAELWTVCMGRDPEPPIEFEF